MEREIVYTLSRISKETLTTFTYLSRECKCTVVGNLNGIHVLHEVIHSYQKTPYLLYMWVKVVLEIEHYEKVDALTVV